MGNGGCWLKIRYRAKESQIQPNDNKHEHRRGPSAEVYEAIKEAIDAGVIVVAAAGNEKYDGMVWPAAYPEVISVGACGWRCEWWWPGYPDGPEYPDIGYTEGGRYRLWWLQEDTYGYNDIPEPTPWETFT